MQEWEVREMVNLAIAAEREACMKLCLEIGRRFPHEPWVGGLLLEVAEEIHARGNHDCQQRN